MAIAILLIKNANRERVRKDIKNGKQAETVKKNELTLNRNTAFLEYTRHAKCRMECRHISDDEVREILETGTINNARTDVTDKPCPSYALEGRTRDNQQVRIVFGQCETSTKVITVIDLETDWSCHCPGDNKKGENNHR